MLNIMTVLDVNSKAKSTVDDKLIQDISRGSMDALHTLYDHTSKSIYAFALSITKNTYDAEDVLQETFLTIYQKACTYYSLGKPMAWIYTIARNFALMKLRERSKTDGFEEHQVENSTAFSQINDMEQRLVLHMVLNTLSNEERQIFMLHAMGGLKNREIAAVMDIPINTVLSKYNRTIKKLRNTLKEEGF